MKFEGLNAVITGGASGIGKSLALHILRNGGKVFVGDINDNAGKKFLEENPSFKESLFYENVNVTSWSSVENFFQRAEEHFNQDGGIDMVFPNAGAVKPGYPDIVGEPDLQVIDVNVKGILYTIQAAITSMRKRKLIPNSKPPDESPASRFRSKFKGKIVVTVSVTGLWPTPCHVVYSASKHACWGAVRALGPRLRRDSITINGVAPNLVEVSESSLTPGDFYSTARSHNLLTPIETVIKGFDMFLDENSEETGQICEASFDEVTRYEATGFRDDRSKESFDVLYAEYGPAEASRVPVLQEQAKEKLRAKCQKIDN